VEGAYNSALENRPETFDGLSVDRADDILALGMVYSSMGKVFAKTLVASPLISAEQTYLMRDGLPNKGFQCGGLNICDNTGNDISLTIDSTDDWSSPGTDTAGSTAAAAFLSQCRFFVRPPNESFIDLDNSAELSDVLHKGNADAVAHIPSGFQRPETHIAPNLPSTYALLAGKHQMNDAIPIEERLVRILENRSGDDGESIAIRRALFALPMPFAGFEVIDLGIAATRAMNAIRPAPRVQVCLASFLIGEHGLELRDGQLVNLFGLFRAGHDLSSEWGRALS
jgi:hypothetical protein